MLVTFRHSCIVLGDTPLTRMVYASIIAHVKDCYEFDVIEMGIHPLDDGFVCCDYRPGTC